MTPAGNTQITTTSPKYGTGAILFDGAGDTLASANHASAFNLGSTCTIDFWYKAANNNLEALIGSNESVGNSTAWFIQISGGQLQYWVGGNQRLAANGTGVQDGNYHHIAITQVSNTASLFFDGLIKNAGASGSVGTNSVGVLLGTLSGFTDRYANGRFDCVRLTKGVARWTTDFTPPQSEADYLPESGGPFPHYIRRVLRGGLYMPRGF